MVMHALKRSSSRRQTQRCLYLKGGQRKVTGLFIFVLSLLFVLAYSPPHALAEPTQKDPLRQIDILFRGTYDHARKDILQAAGPIIIASGQELTLLRGGKEIKGLSPPPGYRALTTVSHITLTIFLLLEPYGEGTVSPDRIEKLEQLGGLALASKQPVRNKLSFSPSLAEEQQTLIDTSRAFIQKIVVQREWAAEELTSFLESVKPQILKNVRQAAKFRIDHFHKQMTTWKQTMGEEEWDQLHVIVLGPVMPRKNNLAVQYFSKLLGVRGEGLKITYAESIFSQHRALQVLGTNLLDTQIGEGYFADPWRMHQDLLGNAAAVYLDELTLGFPELLPQQ